MKRILISFLVAVFLPAAFLAGCGKADGDKDDTELNTEASEENAEEDDGNSSGGSKDSIFSNRSGSSDDEEEDDTSDPAKDINVSGGKDNSDGEWQEAYIEYLDENPAQDGAYAYALIYVDDDDIPELVIDTGFEAGGCQILTWHDGKTDVLQTSRLYFTYLEKKNKLNNCDGHMGYYYDFIYSIEDGKWTQIFTGEYSGFDDEENVDYDEETGRYKCTEYLIDGKETDEKSYYKELKKIYDLGSAKEVTSFLYYDDLISYLKTGKFIYESHSYELFVGDCTWEEAKAACEKKGGYLACPTCDGEFDLIEKLIRQEDKTNYCFYLGGTRDDANSYTWHWIEPGLTQDGCLGSPYYQRWLNGGPSYTDTLNDGTEVDEVYLEYMYRKSDDRFYMNDITNDVPNVYPSFRGRIGYICEYPE